MRAELSSNPNELIEGLRSYTFLDSGDRPRHRWYTFKEGFSPDIVESAIRDSDLRVGQSIADPFCGSGTTTLTGNLLGINGSGIEVNPFLRFVAQTKLHRCDPNTFKRYMEAVFAAVENPIPSRLETFSTFSELADDAKKAGKWLFNSEVLRCFEAGYQRLGMRRSIKGDLARLCLIGAAMDVSNAYKDGKCLRYRPAWQDRNFGGVHFVEALRNRVEMIKDDLESSVTLQGVQTISLGDCREIQVPHKFDLCVTSPPYLNSFDYTDVYRPELFLGRFVSTMNKLRQVRLRTLRSHVQVRWDDPTKKDFGATYEEVFKTLKAERDGLWNARIPTMVQAYFEDMQKVLRLLKKQANRQASVWLIVSTSSYSGVEIPVDLIIADIAHRCGWFLREVHVLRHLRRVSGQQWNKLTVGQNREQPYLRESVIILDRDRRK